MDKVKREKSSHFTQLETETLMSLVEAKISLIESKQIDGSTLRAKEQAWKEIEVEFNRLVCGAHHKDARTLKLKYYRSLKREMRKKASMLLSDLPKTSVSTTGSVDTPLASVEEKFKDYLLPGEGNTSFDNSELTNVHSTPKTKRPFHNLVDQKIEVVKLQKEILNEELEEKWLKKALLHEELEHRRMMHDLERKEMVLKIELLRKKLVEDESSEDC